MELHSERPRMIMQACVSIIISKTIYLLTLAFFSVHPVL